MANNITRWENENPPNLLLAIDPGASYPGRQRQEQIPYAGAALFQWGQLVRAATIKCPVYAVRKVIKEDGEEAKESLKVPPFARPNQLVRTECSELGFARHGGVRDGGGAFCRKCARGGRTDIGEALTVLAVENPLIYKHGTARPADIVALKCIYGAFMGGIDADFYSGPSPEEWKGSTDGTQMTERVVTVLNATERTMLMMSDAQGDDSLSSHTLDAVGLGLFVLGRAGKGMVIG